MRHLGPADLDLLQHGLVSLLPGSQGCLLVHGKDYAVFPLLDPPLQHHDALVGLSQRFLGFLLPFCLTPHLVR